MSGWGVRLFGYVLASGVSVVAVASISEQRLVAYDSRVAVVLFAVLLGVLNATIRPVLRLLTLPLTCLTFGLFALVLNVLLFELADRLTDGIEISWWGAAIGSLVASIASGIIFSVLDEQ